MAQQGPKCSNNYDTKYLFQAFRMLLQRSLFQQCMHPLFSYLLCLQILLTGLTPLFLSHTKCFTVSDYFLRDTLNRIINTPLLQLAFPNNDNAPPFRLQLSPYLLIPLLITSNLCHPEVRVCLRCFVIVTAFVTMPKATVNENGRSVSWQYNIRLSG